MVRSILAAGSALIAMLLYPLGMAATQPAYADPARFDTPTLTIPWGEEIPVRHGCEEDMPCWRWWMGDGMVGPNPPAYLFLPYGPEFDKLAPFYGYEPEDDTVCEFDGEKWVSAAAATRGEACTFG